MTAPSEFSRLLSVARIPPSGTEEILEASPEERAALSKRFDLVGIAKLTAQLSVTPQPRQSIEVQGKIQADVTQRCVVTLEPLVTHVRLNVDISYIPAGDDHGAAASAYPDELEEEFEIYSGSRIDLGEMVAQQMAISLDPYPRKPNASLEISEVGAKIETKQPFAQLAEVVKKQKNQAKTDK